MKVRELPSGRYGVTVEDGGRVAVLRERQAGGWGTPIVRWDAQLLVQRVQPGSRLSLGQTATLDVDDTAAVLEHARRARPRNGSR